MQTLILTIALFILAHSIPVIGPVRRALIATMGKGAYIVGYSMLSIGLLGWVGIAYSEAPFIELWPDYGPWSSVRWMPIIFMLPACIFAVATFTNPNPLSVALKSAPFDPAHPGVVAITRHPLIWALLLWSGAHLIANGDVASVILFGLFTILGAVGPLSIDARKKRALGPEAWASLSAASSNIPFVAILRGRARLDMGGLGWPTIGLGIVIYLGLIWAHAPMIGASPLP